ncbi:MAG: serine/threonine-protein kinase [Deltaproteobacteria bacterium]|nr:serine/threonine-protein kinase [Deltaproteobacteria bacterium]
MENRPQTAQAGQYYLLEKIAQGGMAEIFKGLAYDTNGIKKTVCIKKILPQIAASREFIDMLVDEAKIAVKLGHGNIAQIYDLGKAGEDYFIVMEYVDGQNLSKIHKKVLRQGQLLPLPMICYIIAEIANGLNYMHRKTDEEGHSLNVIHRDISPQNIVISYAGTVKIIDFGIAHAAVKVGHTESGILKGKFAYMAPEQARGDRVDHRADIFSLGVIFHELLTGKRLFKAANTKETLRNVRKAKVPPPSEINPEIPKDIDPIALKALTKDRRHRYPFASDFADELLQFLHTHFPDFKPSQVADYLRNLFREELELSRNLAEADQATPHLILDKTKTTLDPKKESDEEHTSGGAGIDWREFMLEADWPEEKQTSDKGPVTSDSKKEEEESFVDEESLSVEEKTIPSFKKHSLVAGLSILLVIVATAAGYFGWYYYKMEQKPPAMDYGLKVMPMPFPMPPTTTNEKKLATLIIESNPTGASIYMDDKETGQTTPGKLEAIPPGEKHILGLYLGNYKFFKTEFESKPGETQRFHIELAVDYGSIKMQSEPASATVLINGEPVGITPFIKSDFSPGTILKVEVSKEGFASHTEELQISAGKEHLVNVVLERLPSLPAPPPPPIMEHEPETAPEQNE